MTLTRSSVHLSIREVFGPNGHQFAVLYGPPIDTNKLIVTNAVNTRIQGRTDSGRRTFLIKNYIRQNEGSYNEWRKLMRVIALAHLCMYKYIYLPDCYTACTGCPWGFKFQFRLFFVLTPSAISSANVVPVVCVKVVISVTSKIIVLS